MAKSADHHIDVSFSASYSTLNEITEQTENIWIACHGYGQLAKYFIRKFDILDPKKNFILAPQGLSRFYLADHKEVGATWMTKEDRETDMENQKRYFDQLLLSVFQNVDLSKYRLVLFGFSQGVSMIGRLAAYKRMPFDDLILWAGEFPPELTNDQFDFVKENARVTIVLGTEDRFYKMPEFQEKIDRPEKCVGIKSKFVSFQGGHNLERSVLKSLIE